MSSLEIPSRGSIWHRHFRRHVRPVADEPRASRGHDPFQDSFAGPNARGRGEPTGEKVWLLSCCRTFGMGQGKVSGSSEEGSALQRVPA